MQAAVGHDGVRRAAPTPAPQPRVIALTQLAGSRSTRNGVAPPAALFRCALFEDGHASPARRNVVGAGATPADPLAGELAAGCP